MRIDAKNLVKIYGDRSVVNDISFYINKGEVVCLLGPNGAGKTTTFYMVVGLVKPNKGQILLDGQEITQWPMNERAKAGIGYLPQENSIFRNLNVEDNIKLVLEMNEKKHLQSLYPEVKDDVLKLQEHWLLVQILCFLTNHLQVLTQSLSEKLKTISEKYQKKKV